MIGVADDDVVTFDESLQWQVRVCENAGAPVSAAVLRAIGTCAMEMHMPEVVRFADFIPLRLLAAMHALALDRRASFLALMLPTVGGGGAAEPEAMRSAVAQAFAAGPEVIAEYLSSPPQTNEVGRAHPLRIALAEVGVDQPVHVREIGSSAGLLLNVDRLELMPGEREWQEPRISSRLGYDIHPIDASTSAGRLRLSSYVWPDHVERFARLGAAIRVAQDFPPAVRRLDAVTALQQMELAPRSTTFVWHSALLPYLSQPERAQVTANFERLGSQTTETSRFAVASWEVPAHGQAHRLAFELLLTVWSAGQATTRVLADGNSHGTEVNLRG
ncbi:MAG: DUF2332 family protein [Actinobacteria bacterium]|nr:DUF2332 family protein [Actinomycetota bacterium]